VAIRRAGGAPCLRPTNPAKMGNIFSLVTNTNCPRTTLYVYISNDRAQACGRGSYVAPSKPSRKQSTGRMARQKDHPASARTTATVEVAQYLSQAEFSCCNRCVTVCALWGRSGRSSLVRFAASASVRRGTLTLRYADNCPRTGSIDCSARTRLFGRERVGRDDHLTCARAPQPRAT
jgi:hypothetical protein